MGKFFKLSFWVAITIFAISCTDDAVSPTAGFTYDSDELTVTFTNTSKNATSYTWDFGDDETSTETSPEHTYAASGTYTVTLTAASGSETNVYTEEISVSKPLIKVDGDFFDWSEVASSDLYTATVPDGATTTALKTLKICSDENYIYFYMKLDSAQVAPIDILINTDGNSTTGANTWLWGTCGAEVLIEGFEVSQFADGAVGCSFSGGDDQTAWSWAESVPAGSGLISISAPKTVSGTVVEYEGSIVRELISGLTSNIGFGVFTSDRAWAVTGCLPGTAEGAETSAALMSVTLK